MASGWDVYKKFDNLQVSDDESDENDGDNQLEDALKNFDPAKIPKGMAVSGWDDDEEDIEPEPDPHGTPEKELLWAAEEGENEIVERIIKEHPDLINVKDRDGYTALHKAAYSDNHDLAAFLLSHGADIEAQTECKWTPLHSACKWNNPRLVALLLRNGANVNALSEGLQTPLHVACTVSNCRDTLVELLTHRDIQPDLLNSVGETAKQIAKRTGLSASFFDMVAPPLRMQMGKLDSHLPES